MVSVEVGDRYENCELKVLSELSTKACDALVGELLYNSYVFLLFHKYARMCTFLTFPCAVFVHNICFSLRTFRRWATLLLLLEYILYFVERRYC